MNSPRLIWWILLIGSCTALAAFGLGMIVIGAFAATAAGRLWFDMLGLMLLFAAALVWHNERKDMRQKDDAALSTPNSESETHMSFDPGPSTTGTFRTQAFPLPEPPKNHFEVLLPGNGNFTVHNVCQLGDRAYLVFEYAVATLGRPDLAVVEFTIVGDDQDQAQMPPHYRYIGTYAVKTGPYASIRHVYGPQGRARTAALSNTTGTSC